MKNILLKGKIMEETLNQFTIIKSITIILKFMPNLRFTKYNNKSSCVCLMAKENLIVFFGLQPTTLLNIFLLKVNFDKSTIGLRVPLAWLKKIFFFYYSAYFLLLFMGYIALLDTICRNEQLLRGSQLKSHKWGMNGRRSKEEYLLRYDKCSLSVYSDN